MTSTTFFHEFSGAYRWTLKKNIGILILLAVLTFLAGPLILFMTIPGWAGYRFDTEAEWLRSMRGSFASFMGYAPVAAIVLILIFAAVLCVMLFGYMQKRRSVDLFHSLPVRREAMLLGRWCAGITILLAPLLLNFLILWITQAAYGIGVNGWTIFRPMLLVMLMGTAAFTFCMFMAVCSGTMLDTALSVIGVNAGYPLLILCAFSAVNGLLPGVAISINGQTAVLTALAPFAAGFLPFFAELAGWFLPWWILLTAAMLAGSVFLYKKRKSESAESSFAFPIPKILIRFLLTAVGGMGFGLILSSGGPANFWVGLIAGSLIAHVVVEGIYSRGFRLLKKSFRWYGVFAAAFLIFYGVLATGFFGYDTRIPSADEVESVAVEANGNYEYNGGSGCSEIYDENGNVLKRLTPALTEPDSIEAALEAQKKIVGLHRSEGFPYRFSDTVGNMLTLRYQLKDGRSFSRSYQHYNHNDSEAYRQAVQSVTNLKEYKQGLDMVFFVEPGDIKSVELTPPGKESPGKTVVPGDTQKNELLSALQKDLLEKKINYYPESETGSYEKDPTILSVNLEFYSNIEPKNDRLKALLGGYKGKINLNGGGNYNIYSSDSAVYALLRQYGWI